MQKIAVVSGGSKGIGISIVEKLLKEGFYVFAIARSSGELGRLFDVYPQNLQHVVADLSIKTEVYKSIDEIKSKISHIDILVNNAGVFMPGKLAEERDQDYELQMALNVSAAYYLSKAFIPLMKINKDAYIFNICSTASIVAYENGASYCISKHALLGMSKVLRKELMHDGIAVSSILTGATLTDSWAGSELPESRFMKTSSISEALWFAYANRDNCVLEEILLRPRLGDI
jgi:short-subunit dehydrogenase